MKVETTVFIRGSAHHNMCGEFLGYPLKPCGEIITKGLAKRLITYASKDLKSEGLWPGDVVTAEVETCDGDEKPANRSYCVRFRTRKGGAIGIEGILTKRGWPLLDHGLFAERE